MHPYTRGNQKVVPPIFYFFLFRCWTSENLSELDDDNAEGIDIFQCSLHLCQQSSSTLEQQHVLLHSKVDVPPPQPLVHSVLQCLIIGIIMSSQAFCQRTKQVIISWSEVRAIGWMQQHCPLKLCDGLCGVHICVWCGIVMEEQHYTETLTSLNAHIH
jgi:hypothetical protein